MSFRVRIAILILVYIAVYYIYLLLKYLVYMYDLPPEIILTFEK
jgi:hypothetical protein